MSKETKTQFTQVCDNAVEYYRIDKDEYLTYQVKRVVFSARYIQF